MPVAAGMAERTTGERVDRVGDEALTPGPSGGVDAGLASTGGGGLGLDQAAVRAGQHRIAEQRAGLGRRAAGQVDLGRGGPVLARTAPRIRPIVATARRSSGWPRSA